MNTIYSFRAIYCTATELFTICININIVIAIIIIAKITWKATYNVANPIPKFIKLLNILSTPF